MSIALQLQQSTTEGDRFNALFALLFMKFCANKQDEVIKICKLLLDNGVNLYNKNGNGLTSFLGFIDEFISSTLHNKLLHKKKDDSSNKLTLLLFSLKCLVQDRM